MIQGILGIIFIIVGAVAAIFALLSEELNKNKRLKYSVVMSLLVLTVYAMLGSFQSLAANDSQSQNLDGTITDMFAVDSTLDWQPSDQKIKRGDKVTIQVVGGKWTPFSGPLPISLREKINKEDPNINGAQEVVVNYAKATSGSGGDSCIELNFADCYLPDGSWGTLIAKIGSNEPFEIGIGKEFYAPDDGILYLVMNDSKIPEQRTNNSGVLAVKIEIDRR